jgi:hypothetical protein
VTGSGCWENLIGRFDARAQDAWFILNEVRPWPNPVHWWKTRRLFQRVDVSSGDFNIQREDSSFPIRLPAQGAIKFEIAVAPDVRDAKPKGPLRDDWELLENWVKAERPVMLVIRTGSGKTVHARVRYMRPEEFRQAVEDLLNPNLSWTLTGVVSTSPIAHPKA